jgi:hypothetical protein
MRDYEGPLGRHTGRRYSFGPGVVDIIAVAAVLVGGITVLSHAIWGHVPEPLFIVSALAAAPLGLQLSRWRRARRSARERS